MDSGQDNAAAANSFGARLANVLLQDERNPKGGRRASRQAARPAAAVVLA